MTSILDRHRERFLATPGDNQAFEALEEHYFLAGDWQAVIELYEHRITAPALGVNRRELAQVRFRMGQVYHERLADSDRALECFAAALKDDPTNRAALSHIRRTHLGRENWTVALQVAEVEAELPMRPRERASLLAEMGSIWLRHLSDAAESVTLFERALADDPEHPEALAGLAEAYERCDRPEEAARIWEQLADRSKGTDRAAAKVKLARLNADSLGEIERARHLFRDALGADPNNREAIVEVAAQAEARGQWPLLADLLERRFELESDGAARAEIAAHLAMVIRDRLSNPALAHIWYAHAADNASRQPEVYEALADFEREREDDDALFRHVAKARELHGDSAPVSMLLELACLHSERGDDESARIELEIAVSRSPEDALAIEALSDTLARLGRDEELVEILERRASLASIDPEACAAAFAELGALHEERLSDPESALRAYEQAYTIDARSPGVASALERLYRKAEDWGALRGFLGAAARSGPASERLAMLCSLASLENAQFEDRSAAIAAFEAALDIDPEYEPAHHGLQTIAGDTDDESLLLRCYQREADVCRAPDRTAWLMAAIARIHVSKQAPESALACVRNWVERFPDDVRALTACADLEERCGDPERLVALLVRLEPLVPVAARAQRRLAVTYEQLGRDADALAAYERATVADPSDVEALEALVRHYESGGRLEEFADAKVRLAELLPADQRAACLEEIARLRADRLGDVDGAIEVLTRLQDESHASDDVADRLAAMLERAARHDDLAAFLGRRADACDDDEIAGAFELRRAELLLNQLDRPDAAVQAYRAAREHAPDSELAIAGLEAALRATGDLEALVEFLAERIAATTTPAALDRLVFERSVLVEEALADDAEAKAEYLRLVAAGHEPAIRAQARRRLETLLIRTADWNGLRDLLDASLAGADADESADLHQQLAALAADRFDDPDASLLHLETAAALAPSQPGIWRELIARYESAERPAELVHALEARLALGADREERIALHARAATVCNDTLNDHARALCHFERILEFDAAHPAASEFVIAHSERSGDLPRLVALLEARLTALDTAPRDAGGKWAAERCTLRVRIAEIHAQRLDDLDGAIAILEPALAEYGPRAAVAEPLADLYLRADFRPELIELCQKAAAVCSVEAERANWFVRLGDALCRDDRHREAAAAYRQALTDRPDDRAVQSTLCDIYRRLQEEPALIRLLEVELSHLAGSEEVPVRLELAGLLFDDPKREREALLHLRRILEVDPTHHEALALALDLAPRLAASEILLELLDRALARPNAPDTRAALLSQRAQLLATSLDQPEAAIGLYREAIALEPSRSQDRRALRELLVARGDWKAVLDNLFEAASFERGEARLALLREAADTAREKISPDASLPWLARIRSERPDDPKVLERISAVHRAAGRHTALLRALEDEIELASEPLELHLERARILEHELGAPERAIAALEAAHEAQPKASLPLEQLERLYRMTGRDHDRARTLEMLIRAGSGDSMALLCDAAALYGGKLGNPERAAEHLLVAVDASRGTALHPELLRELGAALRETSRPEAWARCAEAELEALDPESPVLSDRRRALRRELATAYESVLGRPDAALLHLRALADLKWTETHGTGMEDLDAIEGALIRLLRARENWLELEKRLAGHLARHPDDAPAWLEIGRLREERLRAPVSAVAAYRAALSLRKGDLEAIRGLRRCSELVGDWEAVVEALRLELDHADDVSNHQRSALFHQTGKVSWHRLGSTTRASRAFAAALECDPTNFASLRSHQRLLEAMEDWSGALDLYESEVEMLGDSEPERRREAALRAGEIARDHTDEPVRALRAYALAADIRDLSLERRRELAELHLRSGDAAAFAEVFGAWCDAPGSNPDSKDRMRLADALETLGREQEALAAVELALALEADTASNWDVAARLRECCGDTTGAAAALDIAAELLPDVEAAKRLRRAAELTEQLDPDRAIERFRAAARRDAGDALTAAALARVSAELGDLSEVIEMANRTIDLADADFDPALLRDTALSGARAARERGNPERAALFYARALEISPDHPDALAGYGETLAGLGDLSGARTALEARMTLAEPDADRALHLAMLGAALRAEGDFAAAQDRLEEAIAADPSLDRAHEDLIRLFEERDLIGDGVAAIELWADCAGDAKTRAERLLRAADWELSAEGHAESAERHLRDALEADTGVEEAWVTLAALLAEQGRGEQALEVAALALDGLREAGPRGRLALIQGRAFEQRGDRREAAEAFRIAAEANPRDIEAALSSARLLRALGDWRPAADTLENFANAHPGDDTRGLADVLQQLGRLLAGPLEDVDGAIAAYRRALELDPERIDSRTALAEFLSHRPADRSEALRHHQALLESNPSHAASLRVLLRLAREQADDAAVATGIGILRALGIATPRECEEAGPGLNSPCAGDRTLDGTLDEKLRMLCVEASAEIARALDASPSSGGEDSDDPARRFRAAATEAEGALTAPALVPLTDAEVTDVLHVTAALALDPDQVSGEGRLVNTLSTALKRRQRRRLRKLLEGESIQSIQSIDIGAWRAEVRALASAVALDESGSELRTALAVLISDASDHDALGLPLDADLSPYIAACAPAQALLRRVVRAWQRRVTGGAEQ